MLVPALSAILCLSLAANIAQILHFRRHKKAPAPTREASELIHSLTRKGGAVVKITVVDPTGLFVLAPRDLG